MAWRELAIAMPILEQFADMMEMKLVKPLRMGMLKTRDVANAERLTAWELLDKVYCE